MATDHTTAIFIAELILLLLVGRALAERAASICPTMKVLFMTGFTKNAIIHNGVLDAGVHLLAKPFSVEELSAKVREALDSKIHK